MRIRRRLYCWVSKKATVGCPRSNQNSSVVSKYSLSKSRLWPDNSWSLNPVRPAEVPGKLVSPCWESECDSSPPSVPDSKPWGIPAYKRGTREPSLSSDCPPSLGSLRYLTTLTPSGSGGHHEGKKKYRPLVGDGHQLHPIHHWSGQEVVQSIEFWMREQSGGWPQGK